MSKTKCIPATVVRITGNEKLGKMTRARGYRGYSSGLLPSVFLLVVLQAACLSEGLSTLLTPVGLLPGVNYLVSVEVACMREGLSTLPTGVWLLPCVNYLVSVEDAC